MIAAGDIRRFALRALQDEAGLRLVRRELDRLVEQRLVGTTRPASMPQLAESMSFGLASSMRVASSFAAKPPNTTEWTAPMRAQASIANTRLRHHRHVEDDAVAFGDAEIPQHGGERLHLVSSSA